MITDRIDSVTKIPESHLGARIPAPKSVKIELTGRCNYRCGFCALRTREAQPKGDMNPELYKRIVRDMVGAGVQEIGVFYLGESFMCSWLPDAIRWAKEAGAEYVFCTTNGSLSDPAKVKACMDAGLDSLKFSVNAYDEEQFQKVMDVKPKLFRRALGNIAKARKERDKGGYSTGLYASSIRYDGEQQAKMEALLREYVLPYVDEHYWLPLYSMGAFATQREAELGYRPTAGNQGRLEALREPLPCWSAFTEGHVRADGGMSACCFDAGGDWVMGDLNELSFMEIWNGPKFQDLREAHLRRDVKGTICEACVAYG